MESEERKGDDEEKHIERGGQRPMLVSDNGLRRKRDGIPSVHSIAQGV